MTDDHVRTYRRMIGRFTTGVAVVLIELGAEPRGLTVNSFTSVSLDPLLLLFCVRNASQFTASLGARQKFSVSVLTQRQSDLSRFFSGARNIPGPCEYERDKGWVWLPRSNAVFLCELHGIHHGGDHMIVVGGVADIIGPESSDDPLVYHEGRYARLQREAAGAV